MENNATGTEAVAGSVIENSTLSVQYQESKRALDKIKDDPYFTWEEREALLLGRLQDDGSNKTKSRVNTQELANIVFDGASRVMAQFPTGKVYPTSKDNTGSAAMMNIVLQKYVIPNANSQYKFLTKLRMWNVYSRVYGSMPALVDYVVSDAYTGPDLWLLNPRTFYGQANIHSIEQMQYCFVDNWMTRGDLEKKRETWKGVDALLEKIDSDGPNSGGMESTMSAQDEKSFAQKTYDSESTDSGKYLKVKLVTRYERNKWTTFAPDYDNTVVREIANPHGNGKLPIVMKECYPLLDRLYGLADFERGKTMQYAMNSLMNLYLDGVKFSIFPPTISTKNGVVKDSMAFVPSAQWQELIPNSIRQLQISPQGLNTFAETQSILKANILNMAATTDTSVSKSTDPGYGKTPEALKQQSAREGARDSWDRYMMEQAIQEVVERFVDMLATQQEKPIPIMLFGKEIEEFQAQYPDQDLGIEMMGGDAGSLTVNPEDEENGLRGKYRYIMDSGTTLKKEEGVENEALRDLIMLAVRVPGGLEQIAQTGSINFGDKIFDFGEAMKRFVITSGITDGDKIVRDSLPQEQQQAPGLGQTLAGQAMGNGPAGGGQGSGLLSPQFPGQGFDVPRNAN